MDTHGHTHGHTDTQQDTDTHVYSTAFVHTIQIHTIQPTTHSGDTQDFITYYSPYYMCAWLTCIRLTLHSHITWLHYTQPYRLTAHRHTATHGSHDHMATLQSHTTTWHQNHPHTRPHRAPHMTLQATHNTHFPQSPMTTHNHIWPHNYT